jgi:2-keto-4-pentenoate hydratase/2-oxohepta-3-ene-1,7-dioic acid hydratase in catechol pathway
MASLGLVGKQDGGGLRLFSYRTRPSGMPKLGVLVKGKHYDLLHYASISEVELPFDPSDLMSLVCSGANGLRYLRSLFAMEPVACPMLALESIEFLAPLRPRNALFAVGWNYLDHFSEGQNAGRPNTPKTYPEYPVFFCKTTNTVTGPFADLPSHSLLTAELDWEVELAIILGRPGRDISVEDAFRFVFGYTVVNDVTARDIQQKRHGGQWVKGKSLDSSAPMGPYVVLSDDYEVQDQILSCSVNGELVQQAKLSDMYFNIPTIIAELSRGLTLQPGDVILTGTPSGVGHYRTPPRYLQPGDLLESSIQGIGALKNRISA